jgi:hypothetical protein
MVCLSIFNSTKKFILTQKVWCVIFVPSNIVQGVVGVEYDKSMEYISQTQTLIGQQRKRLQDLDTGELIEVDQITKRALGQKAFWKVYLIDFLQILGVLDSKQVDVLIYILENTNSSTNTYIGTYRKTANGSGVALETVRKVMRKLIDNNFMKKIQNGVYQISPLIMMKGSEHKKSLLLNYYEDEKTEE